MSGVEIWGAIAGVIGVLEALDHIAPVRFRRRVGPGLREEAASFRRSQIRAVLECLASNRDIYARHIQAGLQSDDRENIESVWNNLSDVVMRSQTLADRLEAAVRRNPRDQQEIGECTAELDGTATTLNTWIGNLNIALQLAESSLRDPETSPSGSETPEEIPPLSFIDDPQLRLFIQEGNLERVENMLNSASRDRADSLNATTLLLACRYRQEALARYCLSIGANTSLRDESGLGCLHTTIGTADIDGDTPEISNILNLLLDHGVDPSISSSERGFTPLHHAADTRNLDAVTTLLDRDRTPINATDNSGKTALWYACQHPSPNLGIIEILARRGCEFVDHQWPQVSGPRGDTISSVLEDNLISRNGR